MSPLIRAWTDGSCSWPGGDRSGGWGYVVSEQDKQGNEILTIGQGFAKGTTNNRMELTAILELLKYLYAFYGSKLDLIIYSDSKWSIKCIRRDWKCKTNRDLLRDIREEIAKVGKENVEFKHVWGRLVATPDGQYVPDDNAKNIKLAHKAANNARTDQIGKFIME